MNVLVLSDTHVLTPSPTLPPHLLKALEAADLIIHAGDVATGSFLRELERYAPVHAVHGNADDLELTRTLPKKLKLEVLGRPVGVVHGDGDRGSTVGRARAAFATDEVDVVVFGHSHFPYRAYVGKTLLFNPGSPMDRRGSPKFAFGWLLLNEHGRLTAGHIFF